MFETLTYGLIISVIFLYSDVRGLRKRLDIITDALQKIQDERHAERATDGKN